MKFVEKQDYNFIGLTSSFPLLIKIRIANRDTNVNYYYRFLLLAASLRTLILYQRRNNTTAKMTNDGTLITPVISSKASMISSAKKGIRILLYMCGSSHLFHSRNYNIR